MIEVLIQDFSWSSLNPINWARRAKNWISGHVHHGHGASASGVINNLNPLNALWNGLFAGIIHSKRLAVTAKAAFGVGVGVVIIRVWMITLDFGYTLDNGRLSSVVNGFFGWLMFEDAAFLGNIVGNYPWLTAFTVVFGYLWLIAALVSVRRSR